MIYTSLLVGALFGGPSFTFNKTLTLSSGDVNRGLANVMTLIQEKKLSIGLKISSQSATFRFSGKSEDLFAEFEQAIGVVCVFEDKKTAPVSGGGGKVFLNYRLRFKNTNAGFVRAVGGKSLVSLTEKDKTKEMGLFSVPFEMSSRYDGVGGLGWIILPNIRVSGKGSATIEVFDLGITREKPANSSEIHSQQ